MLQGLTQRLNDIFSAMKKRGVLTQAQLDDALREIRHALLEADVSLDTVRALTQRLQQTVIGKRVIDSVAPSQMVVKLVYDELVEILGGKPSEFHLKDAFPMTILIAGLQGSGKTTTTAKLAVYLKEKKHKSVIVTSLDVVRPAAIEQLNLLCKAHGVNFYHPQKGQSPAEIARLAHKEAVLKGYEVFLVDTSGRTTVDEAMMHELKEVKQLLTPHETLLVADSMTGQDAVETARRFNEAVGLTGLILTRADSDARGGAILSMRQSTGLCVQFLGSGEKIDALEVFNPSRIARRILNMGDVLELVEKASSLYTQKEAEKLQHRIEKGRFDLNDLAKQYKQMSRLGGIEKIVGMLPGMPSAGLAGFGSSFGPTQIKKHLAIIDSMTPYERKNPSVLKHSRKRRIAKGSGTSADEINRMLKLYRTMTEAMKSMQGKGKHKGFNQFFKANQDKLHGSALDAFTFSSQSFNSDMAQPFSDKLDVKQHEAGDVLSAAPSISSDQPLTWSNYLNRFSLGLKKKPK